MNFNSDSEDDDFKPRQYNTNTDHVQRRQNQMPSRSHSQLLQRAELLDDKEEQQPNNISHAQAPMQNYESRLALKSLEKYQKKKGAPIVARHDIYAEQAFANKSREFDERSSDLNIQYSHQSVKKSEELQKSKDILNKQMNLTATMKGVHKAEVELDSINRYVGYRSQALTVTLTETKGWLRKLVQEVKLMQSSIFPMRYYKQRRDTGQLFIYSKPDGKPKHTFNVNQILSVKISQSVQTQAKTGPLDYPWLFLLETKERQFYLYANTEEERDIWMHEFANFCSLESDSRQEQHLKPHVHDRIDPFLQMEVKNLSQNIMLKLENQEHMKLHIIAQAEQEGSVVLPDPNMSVDEVQDYFSDHKLSMANDQEMESQPNLVDQSAFKEAKVDGTIVEQNNDFIQYWSNGQINYVSKTLIANDIVIEGHITLDEIDTSGFQLPQFLLSQSNRAKYVKIDFTHKRITVQENKLSDQNVKLIHFAAIKEVSFNEDNNQEELDNITSYNFKFHIKATNYPSSPKVDKEYNFFARTSIERQLWVDHFQRVANFMNNSRIAEEEFFKCRFRASSNAGQQSKPLQISQSQTVITDIKKQQGYVEYRQGEIQHYVSDVLKTGDTIVEGLLMKKTRSKVGKFLKEEQIVSRMVMINYKNNKVSFRNVQTTDNGPAYPKFLDFKDIMSVESSNIDIYTGELEINRLKLFRQKFVVYAKTRSYPFFARTEKERELWIKGFCRVIDINNGASFHDKPETYAKLAARSVTRCNTNQRPTKMISGNNYESNAMQITYDTFRGCLMKRIDKREWYHTSNFHKRHFDVKFDRSVIVVKKLATDDTIHKRIQLNSIRSCTIKVEVENVQDNSKEFKRSRSWLSKMRKSDDELCKWNFSFELDISDRTMELYAPTRLDREKWVNMFQLISEMNERLISTRDMTPLDFQKMKQEEERKKEEAFQEKLYAEDIKIVEECATTEQEETKVTGLKVRSQVPKLDPRIKDTVKRVETWLVKNQHLMSKNTVKTISGYESNYMSLNIDRVQGQVYIINPSETAELDPQASYERQDSHVVLTKSNLLVDLTYCSMIFENTQYNRENVEYENFIFREVESVAYSDYQIGEEDLPMPLPVDFGQYCFKITFTLRNTKLIACGSEKDRVQWMRTFNLIALLNRLKIEPKAVNLFIFEQFQQQQFKDAQEQQEKKQTMKLDTQYSDDEIQESVSIDQLYERKAKRKFIEYYSPTCTMTFRFIEGYLIKDIENRKLYHNEQFHIRFFRIVFNTGKLVIKQDRRDKKMRTFNLDQLEAVNFEKRLITWHTPERCNTQLKQVILSKDDIKSKYNIEENSKNNIWQYKFTLQFTGRRFNLTCRTIQELENWLRVLNLLMQMRQESKSIEQVNPFVYEQNCPTISNQVQAYKEELEKQEAQNKTVTEPAYLYGDRDDAVESSEIQNVLILEKYVDPNYNACYYFNRKTQESSWTLPTGVQVKIIDMTKKQEDKEVQEEQEDSYALKTQLAQQSSVGFGRKGFKSKILSDETWIAGYDWRDFKAIAMKIDFKTTQTYTSMTIESKNLVNALISAQAKQADCYELQPTQYSARDHFQSTSPQKTISQPQSPSIASQKSVEAYHIVKPQPQTLIRQEELLDNMNKLRNMTESGYNPVLKLRQQQQTEATMFKQNNDNINKSFTEEIKNNKIENEDENQRSYTSVTHQPLIRTRTPIQLQTKGASVLNQIIYQGGHEEPSGPQQVTVQNITFQKTSLHEPGPQPVPIELLLNNQKAVMRATNPSSIPPLTSHPVKSDSYLTVVPNNVYADLESPSVRDDQSYGQIEVAQKKKKKKKKKKRQIREMSADNRQQDVKSECELVQTLANEVYEPGSKLPNKRAQSVQKLEDVKEGIGNEPILGRFGAVEYIIEGGLTGFSDSDDDDIRQVGQNSSLPMAPRRPTTPKPIVIKPEKVFEDVPQATPEKKTIRKDIIVVKSAAVDRVKQQTLVEPTDQNLKRHSGFLQKFSAPDKRSKYIEDRTDANSMSQNNQEFAEISRNKQVDSDVNSPSNVDMQHRQSQCSIKMRKQAISSAIQSSCLTDNSHRSSQMEQEERKEANNDCEIEEFELDF